MERGVGGNSVIKCKHVDGRKRWIGGARIGKRLYTSYGFWGFWEVGLVISRGYKGEYVGNVKNVITGRCVLGD